MFVDKETGSIREFRGLDAREIYTFLTSLSKRKFTTNICSVYWDIYRTQYFLNFWTKRFFGGGVIEVARLFYVDKIIGKDNLLRTFEARC